MLALPSTPTSKPRWMGCRRRCRAVHVFSQVPWDPANNGSSSSSSGGGGGGTDPAEAEAEAGPGRSNSGGILHPLFPEARMRFVGTMLVQTQRGLPTFRTRLPDSPCTHCGGTGRCTCGNCRCEGAMQRLLSPVFPEVDGHTFM